MTSRDALRILLTLVLAMAAAQLCGWLRVPLPWMIGPLLATAMASVRGLATQSWGPLRNLGQWTIGVALGLYFTPEVTALVAELWWAIAVAIGWALGLGWLFGRWLHPQAIAAGAATPQRQRATSYFAGAIGGASEMTLLAEREGARTDLVAAAHSLRLLIVTVIVPAAFAAIGVQAIDGGVRNVFAFDPLGLVLLALATGAGVACAAFAYLLTLATGLPVAALILGTSPGGIAEMAITAKVLQLGVPVVTAFQVCRLVAVLILVEPIYRWCARE